MISTQRGFGRASQLSSRHLVFASLAAILLAVAAIGPENRAKPQSAAAQVDNCDSKRCMVWGVQPIGGVSGWALARIDTCTGAVTLVAPGAGAAFANTITTIPAGPPYPQLIYGLMFGGALCSVGFPPAAWTPCLPAVVAGATGLGLDDVDPAAVSGGGFYAAKDAPANGSLYDPGVFIGPGGLPYQQWWSDVVCDPTGQWGFMGDADLGGGALAGNALVQVSRANGTQSFARPPGGRAGLDFSGLAYDGLGLLWGSHLGGGLDLINPATGIGVPIWPGVPGMADLASNECNPGCGGVGLELDLGDAPDSTTHTPNTSMTAYPGISARFPVVKDLANPGPPGPFHRLIPDSVLGATVTREKDADLLPDADVVTESVKPRTT
jgi:hypothetical protein